MTPEKGLSRTYKTQSSLESQGITEAEYYKAAQELTREFGYGVRHKYAHAQVKPRDVLKGPGLPPSYVFRIWISQPKGAAKPNSDFEENGFFSMQDSWRKDRTVVEKFYSRKVIPWYEGMKKRKEGGALDKATRKAKRALRHSTL